MGPLTEIPPRINAYNMTPADSEIARPPPSYFSSLLNPPDYRQQEVHDGPEPGPVLVTSEQTTDLNDSTTRKRKDPCWLNCVFALLVIVGVCFSMWMFVPGSGNDNKKHGKADGNSTLSGQPTSSTTPAHDVATLSLTNTGHGPEVVPTAPSSVLPQVSSAGTGSFLVAVKMPNTSVDGTKSTPK